MSDPLNDPAVRRKLAVLRHVDEVTGNVAMTCRYFGISRQHYYTWLHRYQAEGLDGLRDRSRRPKTCPHATDAEVVEKIVHLRRTYHFGPTKISMYLQRYHDVAVSRSGVWRIPPADAGTPQCVWVEIMLGWSRSARPVSQRRVQNSSAPFHTSSPDRVRLDLSAEAPSYTTFCIVNARSGCQ